MEISGWESHRMDFTLAQPMKVRKVELGQLDK